MVRLRGHFISSFIFFVNTSKIHIFGWTHCVLLLFIYLNIVCTYTFHLFIENVYGYTCVLWHKYIYAVSRQINIYMNKHLLLATKQILCASDRSASQETKL